MPLPPSVSCRVLEQEELVSLLVQIECVSKLAKGVMLCFEHNMTPFLSLLETLEGLPLSYGRVVAALFENTAYITLFTSAITVAYL